MACGRESHATWAAAHPPGPLQVLVALAHKMGSEEGDAAGGPVPEAAGADGAGAAEPGDGADELLFFVSTDADATMFGR